MSDTKLTKSAGEHWTCSVLAGLRWSAALTRDGVERTDILAVHSATGRMIEVQVKSASHMSNLNWRVGTKSQILARSDREWFVFVGLRQEPWQAPRAFVVPRDHVVAAAWIRHMEWLTDLSVPSGTRNAGIDQARIQDWVLAGYESRWDLLEEPTTATPVLLPPEFRELAIDDRVGLPPGHPWHRELPAW